METIGIDVSSQPLGTASCLITWNRGSAEILQVEPSLDDQRFDSVLAEPVDKVGLDVPLGWPTGFIDAIVRHRRGEPFGETETDHLVRRETDRWVWKNTLQLPLSVTTDRIAYPAMRVARLLGSLSGFSADRSGGGKVVEVYPAAALRVWELEYRRYKRDKGRDVLIAILKQLRSRSPWLSASDAIWSEIIRHDHAFDALICSLVARAHALGRCHPIPHDQRETARHEGWIAVPIAGSFEELAN
jgi:predicted nuclease with RNAse H fold